jgi:GntR family transcriptional regulator, transcriptional repressor for pyruvate dehydrogenase complex
VTSGQPPPIRPVPPLSGAIPVRRVRKASEQVVDELRGLIATGRLAPGERLPKETVLAHEFGVSRATVREALRVLATHNLIQTTRGAAGGSYVTLPSVDHISEFVRSHIDLLSESENVTLEELLEARALVEVPAARLAAERRDSSDVDRLRAAMPPNPLGLAAREQFVYNKEFHTVVAEACRNKLLYIGLQPIFTVLQTHLARSSLGVAFHRSINQHHQRITEAIEAGDADAAAGEMEAHLEFLRPAYEKAWKKKTAAARKPA